LFLIKVHSKDTVSVASNAFGWTSQPEKSPWLEILYYLKVKKCTNY